MNDSRCTAAEAARLLESLRDWKYRALDDLRRELAACLHSMDTIPGTNCTAEALSSMGEQGIERYYADWQFHVRVDTLAILVMRWVERQHLVRALPKGAKEPSTAESRRFLGCLNTDKGEIWISRDAEKDDLLDVIEWLMQELQRG